MHGRGKHVSLQAENQLAHLRVGFRPYIAQLFIECLRCPRRDAPSFIIDENASVLDARSFRRIVELSDIQGVLPFHRHIRPPVKGRHTHCLGQGKGSVCRPAAVASCNHQRAVYPRLRIVYRLDDILLPSVADGIHIQLFPLYQSVDKRIMPQRAEHHHIFSLRPGVRDTAFHPRHSLNILGKQGGSFLYDLEVAFTYIDRSGLPVGA